MKSIIKADDVYDGLCKSFLTLCMDARLNMVIAGRDPESLIDRLVALIPDNAVWSINKGLSDAEIVVVLARFNDGETGFITMNARTPENALTRLSLAADHKTLAGVLPIMLYEKSGYLSKLLEITVSELRPIFEIKSEKFRATGLRPNFLDKLGSSTQFP